MASRKKSEKCGMVCIIVVVSICILLFVVVPIVVLSILCCTVWCVANDTINNAEWCLDPKNQNDPNWNKKCMTCAETCEGATPVCDVDTGKCVAKKDDLTTTTVAKNTTTTAVTTAHHSSNNGKFGEPCLQGMGVLGLDGKTCFQYVCLGKDTGAAAFSCKKGSAMPGDCLGNQTTPAEKPAKLTEANGCNCVQKGAVVGEDAFACVSMSADGQQTLLTLTGTSNLRGANAN